MDTHGKTLFSWQAPEFKHHIKGLWWYFGLAIIAVALGGFQIFRGDYFGGALIGIIAILAGIIASNKPETIDIHLTTTGIKMADTHVPFQHIKQFWIVDDGRHKTLNLETTTYLNRWVIVELHEQDPKTVRDFLLEILPEHESPAPTFSQWFSHKFKF